MDLLTSLSIHNWLYFCSSMSIYSVFEEEVDLNTLNIKYMLGHSLGEYSALTASDTLSLEQCCKLLKIRGELMQNAYEVESIWYGCDYRTKLQ